MKTLALAIAVSLFPFSVSGQVDERERRRLEIVELAKTDKKAATLCNVHPDWSVEVCKRMAKRRSFKCRFIGCANS